MTLDVVSGHFVEWQPSSACVILHRCMPGHLPERWWIMGTGVCECVCTLPGYVDGSLFTIMMVSSNGNIFRVTGPLCGEFTGHLWITLTKVSNAELWCFLWSAPWINGWVNTREAGDLRRHRTHYDVIVMMTLPTAFPGVRCDPLVHNSDITFIWHHS